MGRGLPIYQQQLVCGLECGAHVDPLFTSLGMPDGQIPILILPEGVFSCYRDCCIHFTSEQEK